MLLLMEWKRNKGNLKLQSNMKAYKLILELMGGAYDLELKAHFCDEIINELFANDKAQN